ncbi:MAG: ATP-binding protein [Gammaproteobacteria bacterium]|nr:ATP-binding protein [Gammaproteobacteria bacterium]
METIRRFFDLTGQSCFVLGPRGTGKTTWLRALLPDALYLDLLDPALHRRLSGRPERLREILDAAPRATHVVIDEIQRVPELLSVIHAVLEAPSPPTFVMTGSSARKLRRGAANLLGGRAANRTLHPFMAAELPEFDLTQSLEFGLLPLVCASDEPSASLHAYASLYLEQEVQAEGLTRNLGAFARFLEAVSMTHAGQLNVAALARECEVERKTVEAYLEILEDLLLAFRLPVFQKRAKRRVAVHPKLYLFDAGVFRSLRPRGPLDSPNEMAGQALEGLVAQHLRAWADYSRQRADIFYWRTRAGSEVDFVVYGDFGLQAIKVKNAERAHASDLRGLKSFCDDYPEAMCALLYRGEHRVRIDNIWCLPVDDFLRHLMPGEAPLAFVHE